jgi:uncharacterized protein involved in tolerance to divalent cations
MIRYHPYTVPLQRKLTYRWTDGICKSTELEGLVE